MRGGRWHFCRIWPEAYASGLNYQRRNPSREQGNHVGRNPFLPAKVTQALISFCFDINDGAVKR